MTPTLIIYMDAMAYRFISKENTPFINSLAKSKKYRLAKLKTLLAFTGIEYAFFTGKNPDRSGIWTEFIYSPKTSPFKGLRHLPLPRKLLNYTVPLKQLAKGRSTLSKFNNIPRSSAHYFDTSTKEKVWKTDFFKNKRFIYYGWPYFAKDGKSKIDPINRSDSYKVKKLIKSLNDNTEVYAIHLVGLDNALHKHGTSGEKARKLFMEKDSLIKKLYEAFHKKFKKFNLVVWSDHGFINVHTLIETKMNEPKDYISFYDSTMARFWFKNKKNLKKKEAELKNLKYGFILTKRLKKKYNIPEDRRYGDLIFILNPGYMFMPNCYQSTPLKGMHGYAPDKADLDGIFISNLKFNKKTLSFVEANKILRKIN
jgi:predicted AlkP superfamily pyrophosphatase or phosphodiesterase